MKQTFAGRIREAARALGEFTAKDLGERMGVKTYTEENKIRLWLKDFLKRGEMRRVAPGRYVYAGQDRGTEEKRQRMWRVLRARRAVTAADLQELAGASAEYAWEWLRALKRQGLVAKTGRTWRLLHDPVEMPTMRDNAEKIRRLRAAHKALADELARIEQALAQSRRALESLSKEAL